MVAASRRTRGIVSTRNRAAVGGIPVGGRAAWEDDREFWNLPTGQFQLYLARVAVVHEHAATARLRLARRWAKAAMVAAVVVAAWSAAWGLGFLLVVMFG